MGMNLKTSPIETFEVYINHRGIRLEVFNGILRMLIASNTNFEAFLFVKFIVNKSINAPWNL